MPAPQRLSFSLGDEVLAVGGVDDGASGVVTYSPGSGDVKVRHSVTQEEKWYHEDELVPSPSKKTTPKNAGVGFFPEEKRLSLPQSMPSKPEVEGPDLGTLKGFFQNDPGFYIPFMLVALTTHLLTYIPPLEEYFRKNDMKPWGFLPAAKMCAFVIVMAFALHGWIAVHHDRLIKLGLKFQKNEVYEFQNADASVRCTLIWTSQIVYAVMPVRMGTYTWTEFVIGYSILLIVGDAWFSCCHLLFHKPGWYQMFHKLHHTWKQPTVFASYYIRSYTHVIQEHIIVIPLMLFCPIPLDAFLLYQYWGTPGAQIQHCGFDVGQLYVPFCGPLKWGHIMTALNPWTFLLGGQSSAMHDLHHEKFNMNFQLSYSYLDKIWGTYVNPELDEESCEQQGELNKPFLLSGGP